MSQFPRKCDTDPNRTQTTYPSGRTIGYAYDAAGRVAAITVDGQPLLGNIGYQPFGAPATVNLSATAADSDGTVSKVEFYRDTTLIATVTTPSSGTTSSGAWTYSDTNVAAGTYSYTAKAYDNTNAVTTSVAALVTVSAASAGSGNVFYIHADHLNTPRLITNPAQQAVWRRDQAEPFGAYPANSNPSGLGVFEFNLRFAGQYFDNETGLHYNYFRDYDPSIGRYVQSDPIGLAGGINTYAYVGGNPLSYSDPLGLFEWPSIPQPALDFATGVSDAASFGLGPLARSALDVSGGIDVCSASYTAGQYASFFLGAGRLAYAGVAKALPQLVAQGATSIETALAVSAARNTLKQAARLGTFPNYRIYTAEQVLAKYGADPAAITAAATRTMPLANAAGANLAIGAGVGRATCGCQ